MKFAATMTIIAAVLSSAYGQQDRRNSARRTLTAAEAHQLVYTMLAADDWTKLPGFGLYESPSGPDDRFYFIHVEHTNPTGGSAIGHYAVDQRTGDV